HGRTQAAYLHPLLQPILAETYGIAVYQEQVMQIARDVAGFSLAQADELRKVMGKKQVEKVPVYRKKFIEGAQRNGIDEKLADDIFRFVEPFAGYGFPKGHAAAYGWIAYQTAFLKANFPLEYFAALMTSVKNNTDKLVEYIDEAKKMGLRVLPPDVNHSLVDFAVVKKEIRFGLSAVKGVGEGAVRSILQGRASDGPFVDLFDFAKRVDVRAVNRRVFEALIKCGALDGLPGNRAAQLDALDVALELSAQASRDSLFGQASLFGDSHAGESGLLPRLRPVSAPSTLQALTWEKETLGVFISGHPLADVAEALVRSGAFPIKQLKDRADDELVTVAGMLTSVRRTITKTQQQMLIATIEDMTGSIEVIVFAKSYPELQALFIADRIVTIKGRLRIRERRGTVPGSEAPLEHSVHVNEVQPFVRPIAERDALGWHVSATSREQIDRLAHLLDEWPGTVPIALHIGNSSQRMPRDIAGSMFIRSELQKIFGSDNVREGSP
ncbi:MAG: OB-fold nucleic acid binding domain-containing protein, partial [Candidatus Eremiobacteraeota bacterium]|nr:OB-fold nucleic acid binding domain-containing protein [Candidatus Eremiobacteraeota bacterium]